MRNVLVDFVTDLRDRQRISLAVAKGMASRSLRVVDPRQPRSWEFSGFSQNGEDGLLEVLRGQLRSTARSFLEIGSADGVQNNTSWLLVVEKLLGVMVEGSPTLSAKARRLLGDHSIGSRFIADYVTRETAPDLLRLLPSLDVDIFSLDIDGNDLHVAGALFDAGLRPRIAVVEYNSVFGPVRSVTIPYSPRFNYRKAHPSRLYYGVSLAAWRRFFTARDMRFVTVDSHGVNAFFADPTQFESGFLDAIQPIEFAENRYQVMEAGLRGEAQFALIEGCSLLEV